LKSLELIEAEEWRRQKLAQLAAALKHELRSLRWRLLPSVTPIQPLIIGGNDQAMEISAALRNEGILVPAIRPPTVAQGTARLRISLSASHTVADVARLGVALRELDRQAPGPCFPVNVR
jgi:8-amino-7-oxononanoate synthase